MNEPRRSTAMLLERATRVLGAAGLEDARLEAELLLAHVLECARIRFRIDSDAPLPRDRIRAYFELVRRRVSREPAAYLLGSREFYSLEFAVGPGVLVPRPETEHLVERGLRFLGERMARSPSSTPRVLDVGTGSGAIAVAVAINSPRTQVVALDRSMAALRFAARNARANGVAERVRFVCGDLADLDRMFPLGAFDLVLANPPYVAVEHVRDEVAHEPALALVSNLGPFPAVYQRLIATSRVLSRGGMLAMEVGAGQADVVKGLVRASDRFDAVDTEFDLAGIERVVVGSGFRG